MLAASSIRHRFRSFPLDDGLLLFHPPTGTNVRLSGARVQGLRRSAPRVAMFGITNACNLACDFCSRDEGMSGTWTVDTAFQVLQGLSEAGTLEVAFGGGEPFVFLGFAELLQRLHAETRLAMHVTTNGTLIDDVSWRDCAGLLGHVRVSIYNDVVWRRCAEVLAEHGQRWGANVLVPRHRGFDRLKPWQILWRDQDLDCARLARNPSDQGALFELEDHLMNAGRGDLEESAEVGFGRWAFVEQGVGVDERQVLALLLGESR